MTFQQVSRVSSFYCCPVNNRLPPTVGIASLSQIAGTEHLLDKE
jgi:hypothetical protein